MNMLSIEVNFDVTEQSLNFFSPSLIPLRLRIQATNHFPKCVINDGDTGTTINTGATLCFFTFNKVHSWYIPMYLFHWFSYNTTLLQKLLVYGKSLL